MIESGEKLEEYRDTTLVIAVSSWSAKNIAQQQECQQSTVKSIADYINQITN